ncbi:divergent PAP2 family protein [Paenibacillus sp. YN15]|uniref:divergent PAP2 family protein n=1 Tax=Paenibacillus sp. YN15 TaxID=1742774 RepID=UPI000DCDFD9A|nr:divergent PAP2 family protein [Paenibacillus sp. YN15]RAV05443.1 divergent PAP2 family protein [Paenibacillus sp. YN15]
MNRALGTALASVGAAQFLKVPISFAKTGQWRWSALTESGGMPSSHSAGAAALAAYTALKKGTHSMEFAISALYGLIVMADAMGVRRHAGEIAVEVNALGQRVEGLSGKPPSMRRRRPAAELQEKLGHLPIEVAAGTVLGIGIGAISFFREWEKTASASACKGATQDWISRTKRLIRV